MFTAPSTPAKPGDTIMAAVDGEYTPKYLMLDGQGEFYLKAANSKYDDIHPTPSLEVYGLVVGQFRRYWEFEACSHAHEPVLIDEIINW